MGDTTGVPNIKDSDRKNSPYPLFLNKHFPLSYTFLEYPMRARAREEQRLLPGRKGEESGKYRQMASKRSFEPDLSDPEQRKILELCADRFGSERNALVALRFWVNRPQMGSPIRVPIAWLVDQHKRGNLNFERKRKVEREKVGERGTGPGIDLSEPCADNKTLAQRCVAWSCEPDQQERFGAHLATISVDSQFLYVSWRDARGRPYNAPIQLGLPPATFRSALNNTLKRAGLRS